MQKGSPFPEMQPLVSCVMVTGKSPQREALARVAIQSYQQQDYPNRELVIVNDGEFSLACDDPTIREIRVPTTPRLSLGELRNIGLEEARGDWICQWDDDDYSGPGRIRLQLEAARPGCCVLLLWQVRYSFVTNYAFVAGIREGIPGTILHPRTSGRYRAEGKHEDTHFWKDVFGTERRILLDNNSRSGLRPSLYMRFYHGANTWNARHVMQGRVQPTHANRWDLAREDKDILERTLRLYHEVHPPRGA